MRRYLVTGASGFIGARLVRQILLEPENFVTIISRKPPDHWAAMPRAEIIKADLTELSEANLHTMMDGIDDVLHSAWCMKADELYHSAENQSHRDATLRLGRAAAQVGVARFSGLGTCLEYGHRTTPALPNAPLNPQTSYATAKVECFAGLSQIFASCSVQFSWHRLYQVIHRSEPKGKLIPYVMDALKNGQIAHLSDGAQIRDFIDVDQACMDILRHHNNPGSCVSNICTGKPKSVRQKCLEIAEQLGAMDLLRFDSAPRLGDDPSYLVGTPAAIPLKHAARLPTPSSWNDSE